MARTLASSRNFHLPRMTPAHSLRRCVCSWQGVVRAACPTARGNPLSPPLGVTRCYVADVHSTCHWHCSANSGLAPRGQKPIGEATLCPSPAPSPPSPPLLRPLHANKRASVAPRRPLAANKRRRFIIGTPPLLRPRAALIAWASGTGSSARHGTARHGGVGARRAPRLAVYRGSRFRTLCARPREPHEFNS